MKEAGGCIKILLEGPRLRRRGVDPELRSQQIHVGGALWKPPSSSSEAEFAYQSTCLEPYALLDRPRTPAAKSSAERESIPRQPHKKAADHGRLGATTFYLQCSKVPLYCGEGNLVHSISTGVRLMISRCLLILAFVIGPLLLHESIAEEPKSEFGFATVVFVNAEMRWPSYILTNASVRDIGGRKFLVGTGADTKRKADFRTGKKIAIALESISSFVEIETQKEYAEYLEGGLEEESLMSQVKRFQ